MELDNPGWRARASPERLFAVGWSGLSSLLAMLGIHISAAALEKRGRVHGLPRQGGRTHGKTVWFRAHEIDQWTRHLVDLTLEECLRRADHAWRSGRLPELRVARRKRPRGSKLPLPSSQLYAVTARSPSLGEQVHRDADAWTYASVEATAFEHIFAACEMPRWPWSSWLYGGMRRATDTDLVAMLRGSPRNRGAGRLYGAFEPYGNHLSWLSVPGSFFGLPASKSTRCLVAPGLPHMAELKESIDSTHPMALWIVWSRRKEVQPVTLDEVNPRLEDTLREVSG